MVLVYWTITSSETLCGYHEYHCPNSIWKDRERNIKQVQPSQGEILTTAEVAERLLQEVKDRDAKKKNKNPDEAHKEVISF